MTLKYVMKEQGLEMDTHFDTLYYRQQAQKIFSATLGREVEPWEIEVVEKNKKIFKNPLTNPREYDIISTERGRTNPQTKER